MRFTSFADIMKAPSHSYDDVNVLYADHHRWLCSWLQRRLNCQEDAADLAQDTFIRVLMRPSVLERLREPRAYLASIARGLVIDHWRRQSLEQAILEALASLPEAYMPSEQDRLILKKTLHDIDRLLQALSRGVREAFVLSRIEGLSYPQIAERLGISESTAKRYVARGLETCLARMLEDE